MLLFPVATDDCILLAAARNLPSKCGRRLQLIRQMFAR
jgi:hypothetical protein